MMRTTIATLAGLAGLLHGCANLPEPESADGVPLSSPETFISFANQRNAVHSWQADGLDGLWVQDGRRNWYYARFIGPCFGIDHAFRLGFDTGSSNRIDRFSFVVVPDERDRCAIMSFRKSEPPPDGKRRSLAGEEVKD
jgi:hypothetical protein